MKETDVLKFKVDGLDGIEKEYCLRPLMRKEASLVFHTSVQSLVVAIGQGIGGLSKILESNNLGKESMDGLTGPISSAVGTIDFEKLWDIAERIFKGGMVSASKPICAAGCTFDFGENSLGDTGEDYFRDHPEELYVATAKAIDANWPLVFISAREKIRVLLAKLAAKRKSGGSTKSDGQ